MYTLHTLYSSPTFFLALNSPNLIATSAVVTKIESTIRMIMIHVILDMLLQAIESESISVRSRNTLQRSLRIRMRCLISRHSRAAAYKGYRVGSASQKNSGTSRTLLAIP